MSGIAPSFGKLMRDWRKARGLTQEALALRAGLSTRHLSFLETGRSRPGLRSLTAIAAALELPSAAEDALRSVAGFAPKHNSSPPDRCHEIAWDATLGIEEARTVGEVVIAAAPLLSQLGLDRFFVATIRRDTRRLSFDEIGTFPATWARSYLEQRYDISDPLVAEALTGRSGFFWADVLPGRRLSPQALRMFGTAADAGVRSGFIAALPDGDQVRMVSMMGLGVDSTDKGLRLALRNLGWSMIARMNELKKAPATFYGRH